MMLPDSLQKVCWPARLARIIHQGLSDPPKLAQEGMPLFGSEVDHVAVAVSTPRDLRFYWQMLTNAGAGIIEPVLLWPDDVPGCPAVPDTFRKWMTTLDCSSFKLVLLAPHNKCDLIANFLGHTGPGVHHIAFATKVIRHKLRQCLAIPGVEQASVLVKDADYLSQVFLRTWGDVRIVELIERKDTFDGTFTCRNIAALTAGEANETIRS